MEIIKSMEQGTEEWFAARGGKLTASNAQTIAIAGKGLETYIFKTLAEKYSNNRNDFTTPDIERGIELEGQARDTYEIEYTPVEQVAMVIHNDYVSCSPDGLVGEDGGLEIKCVNDTNYLKIMLDGEKAIDKKFYWQCQMSLLITGRKWWDLAIYNPNFEKNLLVFRQTANTVDQEKLIIGIEKGTNLLKKLEEKFNQVNK